MKIIHYNGNSKTNLDYRKEIGDLMPIQLQNPPVFWFTSPLDDVFPDTAKPFGAASEGTIEMAKNEAEALQLILRADVQALLDVTVELECEFDPKVLSLSWGFLENVYSSHKSWDVADRVLRRAAPCAFPEYISQRDTIDVRPSESRCVYLTARSTKHTPAGEYHAAVTIRCAAGSERFPVTITVRDVVLPNAWESDYNYECWMNIYGLNPNDHYMPKFLNQHQAVYGIEPFSEEYFKLMENYARAARFERQTTAIIPLFEILARRMSFTPDGSYVFDWSEFDRVCDIFLDIGKVKYLSGLHVLMGGDVKQESEDPEQHHQCCWTFEQGPDGRVVPGWVLCNSERGRRHIEMLFTQLFNHLRERWISERWIQHVADEVQTETKMRDTLAVYRLIHKLCPQVKTIDACGYKALAVYGEELDIHVPIIDQYDQNHEQYDAIKQSRSDVWSYTCIIPQQSYMSRLGDYKLLCTRLLHWYNFKEGLKGYLHWAWDLWSLGDIPNKPFDDLCCSGHAGDGWLVYPDKDNLDVLEGPRSYAMRDGIEDYELIRIARQKDPGRVDTLLRVVIRDATDYTVDHDLFARVRHELFDIACGQ